MKKIFTIIILILFMFIPINAIKALSASDMIAAEAERQAWPLGTSEKKYKYSTGAPTDEYKNAMDTYLKFSKSKKKKYKWAKGASCSVYVASVIRATGYNPKWPISEKKIRGFLKKSSKWKQVKLKDAVAGDVFLRDDNGHVMIYGGKKNGKHIWYQAHAKVMHGTYGYADYGKAPTKKKNFTAWHATGDVSGNNSTNTVSGGNVINDEAFRLAWPHGTSSKIYRYHYSKYTKFTKWSQLGKSRPTKEFQKAYDKVRPDHWSWGSGSAGSKYGYGPRVGASCDVFVGTVIRSSGYDKKMPFGLSSQWKHYPKYPKKWQEVKYTGKKSDLEPGDIITYPGGHVMIYVEKGGKSYLAEAGLNSRFGVISKYRKAPTDRGWIKVWRPIDKVKGNGPNDTEELLKEIKVGKAYTKCNQLLSDKVVDILKYIFLIIQIITPIILIVLTMVDFAKAVVSSDKGELNKALTRFLKRAIVAAFIFMVPTFINFIMDITGVSDGVCGIT